MSTSIKCSLSKTSKKNKGFIIFQSDTILSIVANSVPGFYYFLFIL